MVRELVDARAEIRRLSGAVEDLRRRIEHTAAGEAGEIKWRGNWDILEDYDSGDWVKIAYGIHSGSYLCTDDVAAVESLSPWNGIKWALVGKCVDQGTWA